MKITKIIVSGVAVISILSLVVAFLPRRYDETFYPMGGIPFKVVVYGKNFIEFDKIMERIENRVARLEKFFNLYYKTSELSKLNEKADQKPYLISLEMSQMFNLSDKWYRLSGGAFDPSIAPLVNLWKRAGNANVLPSDEEIKALLRHVGMGKIDRAEDGGIYFAAKDMELDFGAIAKGFIVDKCYNLITMDGVESGVIEAGGDAYVFVEEGTRIGVQDPTDSTKLMATVEMEEGAIVTSGNYERYVEIDGKRYSHIIDPRTGYPVDNGIISVTVIGGDAADADALATSITVLGVADGISLADKLGNIQLIIVEEVQDDFIVHASKNLLSKIDWQPSWSDKVRPF